MLKIMVIAAMLVLEGIYLIALLRDCLGHKEEMRKEKGNPIVLAVYSLVLYFGATFGLPDFAIGSVIISKLKWLEEKKIPGTLICECTLPMLPMAWGYLILVDMDMKTFLFPIAAQLIGSVIGPKIAVRMSAKKVKTFISIGLFVGATMILLSKLGIVPESGNIEVVRGWRLVYITVLGFAGGILNQIGVGSFSVTLAGFYAVGISSIVAYPIMMCACALGDPLGAIQFVKEGMYGRKLSLICSLYGCIGALFALRVVKGMQLGTLMWIVMIIVYYSAISMMKSVIIEKE